jgi:hypothetical protein
MEDPLKKFRPGRPTPALIVAIVALVFAMVGTGYAAFQLPAKSVGTKQLKANAITTAKVKAHAITGKKLKLNSIGTVPKANHAVTADTANALPAPQLHLVGAAGEPPFLEGSGNVPAEAGLSFPPASFFKDADGVVHLEGIVKVGGSGLIFTLPPGFRPGSGKFQPYPGNEVILFGSNLIISGKDLSGSVIGEDPTVSLGGISFRAES